MGDTDIADQAEELVPAEPVAATTRPWRGRILLVARLAIAAAIGYFVVQTTINLWPDVRSTFEQLSWSAVALSLVAAVLAVGATVFAWRGALDDLDHRVPVGSAAQVFLVGQLGKFLPGSVWSYVVSMELGRRVGIPRARAFLASLVTTGIGLTVGLTLGAPGLVSAWRAAADPQYAVLARVVFYSALVMLPFGLVCAHPRVLTRLVALLLRVLRRDPLDKPLSWRGVLTTAGWSAVGYLFFALHVWLLARTQAPLGWSGLVVCVGAISLAVGVSTAAFVAPSGIGVREFVIAITLTTLGASFSTWFAIALASRLIVTVADLVAAGAGAALAVRRLHRPTAARP